MCSELEVDPVERNRQKADFKKKTLPQVSSASRLQKKPEKKRKTRINNVTPSRQKHNINKPADKKAKKKGETQREGQRTVNGKPATATKNKKEANKGIESKFPPRRSRTSCRERAKYNMSKNLLGRSAD